MTLLSFSDIDNICRRAADYTHTWDGSTLVPSQVLDFYHIDMFRNLYNTGLRYDELFDMTRWSKPATDYFLCKTAKGSNDRTFHILELSDYFILSLESNSDPYPMCRYTTAVRYFKKVIQPMDIKLSQGGISLHLFRHNKCKQMHDDGFSYAEIAEYLGEVYLGNIEGYIKSDVFKFY